MFLSKKSHIQGRLKSLTGKIFQTMPILVNKLHKFMNQKLLWTIFPRNRNSLAQEVSKGKNNTTKLSTTPINPLQNITLNLHPICLHTRVAYVDNFNNNHTHMVNETLKRNHWISLMSFLRLFSSIYQWVWKIRTISVLNPCSRMISHLIQQKEHYSIYPCNLIRLKQRTYAAFSPKRAPFCFKALNSSSQSSTQCNKTICIQW